MRLLYIILYIMSLTLLTACSHEKPQCVDPWATTEVDETTFVRDHHYWKNANFVMDDTLALLSYVPGRLSSIYTRDSAMLQYRDEVVVADIAIVPDDSIDSVWVMVARDQMTMGWVSERDFLQASVPDHTISRFISGFSDSRLLVLLACLSAGFIFFLIQRFRRERFLIVHFNDVRSVYPTLLCLTVSASAAIYGSIQHFWPSIWVEYYFHPTLNPFGQSEVIMVFLLSVWAIIIVLVAVLEDLRKLPNVINNVSYIFSLLGVCMVLYFVFSISVQYYLGYALLLCYWTFAILCHWRNNHTEYRCGNCGSAMRERGRCGHCGAINE